MLNLQKLQWLSNNNYKKNSSSRPTIATRNNFSRKIKLKNDDPLEQKVDLKSIRKKLAEDWYYAYDPIDDEDTILLSKELNDVHESMNVIGGINVLKNYHLNNKNKKCKKALNMIFNQNSILLANIFRNP